MSTILSERIEDGVTLVTLNRPERRNALAMSLVTDVIDEMKRLRYDRETRVVILNGAGQGFCAGADLVQEGDSLPGAEGLSELGFVYRMQEHLAEMMIAVHELPPSIVL